MQKEYLCVAFDTVFRVCPFFVGDSDVNDGYGCKHPSQEEGEVLEDEFHGACTHWSCPLVNSIHSETLFDPSVDWNGVEMEDLEVQYGSDPEYVLIRTGSDSTLDEQKLRQAYASFMDRYQMRQQEREKK